VRSRSPQQSGDAHFPGHALLLASLSLLSIAGKVSLFISVNNMVAPCLRKKGSSKFSTRLIHSFKSCSQKVTAPPPHPPIFSFLDEEEDVIGPQSSFLVGSVWRRSCVPSLKPDGKSCAPLRKSSSDFPLRRSLFHPPRVGCSFRYGAGRCFYFDFFSLCG